MARFKGTFSVAANYEPLIAAPFDARELVETQSDLTNPVTWARANGDCWVYVGMDVRVVADPDPKLNGTYTLINEDYTKLSNWRKSADVRDIIALQEQIDNINAGVLPEVGLPSATFDQIGGVKLSFEIGLNEEGQLKINEMSTDKLVQGTQELIFFGGDASL